MLAVASETPLHPSVQERVDVTSTGRREVVDGRTCALFTFVERGDGAARRADRSGSKGTVWVDVESGAAVKIVATPDPLPPLFTEMSMELSFDLMPSGAWVATRVRVGGSYVLLFVKRSIFVDMELAEHWRRG